MAVVPKVMARRVAPALLIAVAVIAVWLSFAFVTPYMLSHQPGPQNPTFWWYMLYGMFPPTIIVVVILFLLSAWILWRRR
jgi:uncharacterized membrane protein